MPRDSKVYLEDILEAIRKIRIYTEGLSFEEFQKDSKTVDAVVRNLEIVGEAVKQLPVAAILASLASVAPLAQGAGPIFSVNWYSPVTRHAPFSLAR